MLTTDRDRMLLERLNRHPHLRARMESLLAVVEAGRCQASCRVSYVFLFELRSSVLVQFDYSPTY